MNMKHGNNVIANQSIVLREEYDDWAILFNPATSEAFGLNPISVFIYKRLDGSNTLEDIITELRLNCSDVPDDADMLVQKFIEDLIRRNMAHYLLTGNLD